jgi:phenylpropionate dioxygenase-like ring-hydroxylating dioxygenase large terminal subunit
VDKNGENLHSNSVLTKEQNRLVTDTDAGTPGGDVMRRYWQPAALSEELGAEPVPVRVLGEDLVLFRDAGGKPALVERQCPHRLADLSYGFLDRGTLRCIYHGWLFDGTGRCLEQPGEAADSTYKDRVRLTAYPCYESNGIILTYMGPGEPPAIPSLPFLTAPPESVWVTKALHECNYLQANEGNVDPQHLSFLHRTFASTDPHLVDVQRLIGVDVAPEIELEAMPYGFRIYAIRTTAGGRYVRITNFIMPNNSSFQGGPVVDPAVERIDDNSAYQQHWHVPIDNESHWKYQVYYRLDGPVDKAFLARMLAAEDEPYNRRRRAANRYLQDRSEQGVRSLAGMGFNFQDQDRYATESQGRILDRSREHLAATDRGVTLMRKYLLDAIADVQAGKDPLLVTRDASADPFAEMVVIGKEVPVGTDVRTLAKRETSTV